MTTRSNWEFACSGAEVLAGATAQLANAKERLAFWTTEKDKSLAAAREAGLTITDYSEQFGSTSNRSSVPAPSVTIDPVLLKAIQHAHERVAVHRDRIKNYARWVQVLARQPSSTLKLHMDDVLYFWPDEPTE